MNVAGWGQGLQGLGLAQLQALAGIENDRRWGNYEQTQAENEAQAQAVAGLIGTVAGAGKGAYTKRKDQFDQEQQATQRQWEAENFVHALHGEKQTARPAVKDYNVLDDIDNSLGWLWR